MTFLKTNRSTLFLTGALILAGLAGAGVDRMLLASQANAIKRTILLRTDDPAGKNYEAVMGIAEIPPGGSSGKHTHYGIEIGYVLEGNVVVEHEGRPTVTLKPGETFRNDAAHDAKNNGSVPAKLLAIYIVEKGKPLAEPAR